MSNVRITRSLIDDATITSSEEATGYDDDYVVDDRVAKTWRSVGLGLQYVNFDCGSAIAMKMAAAFNHNMASGQAPEIRVQASAASDYNPIGFSQNLTPNIDLKNAICYFDLGTQTYRYWRFRFFMSAGGPTYYEAGRLVIGSYFEPSPGAEAGIDRPEPDPSIIIESEGQQTYSKEKQMSKRFNGIAFGLMSDSDLVALRGIWRIVGRRKGIVITLDPTNELNESTIFGRFTTDYNPKEWRHNMSPITVDFRELL